MPEHTQDCKTDSQMKSYIEQFCQECTEIIEKVCDDILRAEAEPDNPEILNAIFRGVHTIKGSAGTFGLNAISGFVHHLEGLLDELRHDRLKLSPEMADFILACMDHVGRMIKEYREEREPGANPDMMVQIAVFLESAGFAPKNVPEPPLPEMSASVCLGDLSLSPETEEQFRQARAKGLHLFRICLRYTSEHLENGYDPLVFLKKLHAASILYHVPDNGADPLPPLSECHPLKLWLNPVICVAAEHRAEEIWHLGFDPFLLEIQEIIMEHGNLRPFVLPDTVDPESLQEFIMGSSEMLESAERAVIEFEKNASPSAINEIFRVAHNIKGDADFIGLKHLNRFAHALESLLDKLRSGSVSSKGVGDILLASVDFLWQNIRKLEQGMEITEFPAVYEKFKQYETGAVHPDSRTAKIPEPGEDIKAVFFNQISQYRAIIISRMAASDQWSRRTVYRAVKGLGNAAAVMKMEKLHSLSKDTAASLEKQDSEDADAVLKPLLDYMTEMESGPRRIGEILMQEGKISEEDLNEGLNMQKRLGEILVASGKISEEDIVQALKKQELLETMKQVHSEEPSVQEVRTMRVDEHKIEQLTNLAGELLIARNTYDYLLSEIRNRKHSDREIHKIFKENLHLFTRLTNDIHYGVMSLRMVPVGGLFRKFTRLVRDIGRKQGKNVELVIKGEDTEIDKKAAEVLTDPLVHLVRNACDHGIEPVSERLRLGKGEKGTLLLTASHEGSNLCIRVRDDGRGIDRPKLFEKARKEGMEILSPDDPALLNAIFLPGISTCEEATSISGRGVGMDVVKTAVQSLGGSVDVESETGNGTEIRMFIPMTMGIDEVLLIESGKNTYALSLSCILETLKIRNPEIRQAADRRFIYYRGDVIRLYGLENLLHRRSEKRKGRTISKAENAEIPVIILKTGKGKFGVIVDRFIHNMELAIRPVPRQLTGLDIAAGVSIMGDGRIILVLNPEKLL